MRILRYRLKTLKWCFRCFKSKSRINERGKRPITNMMLIMKKWKSRTATRIFCTYETKKRTSTKKIIGSISTERISWSVPKRFLYKYNFGNFVTCCYHVAKHFLKALTCTIGQGTGQSFGLTVVIAFTPQQTSLG